MSERQLTTKKTDVFEEMIRVRKSLGGKVYPDIRAILDEWGVEYGKNTIQGTLARKTKNLDVALAVVELGKRRETRIRQVLGKKRQ